MLITKAPGGAPDRTWRPPLEVRIARVVGSGAIVALPTGILTVMLWASHVPLAGWISLAVWLAAWGFLARRVLAQSLTLTADTVLIRNVFTAERVALADVTEVGFHRGKLIVTWRRAAFVPVRTTVGTAILGYAYWSGRRSAADTMADAISDAAGLPPLPPRREIISLSHTWLLLFASALVFGFGVYLGPMHGVHLHRHPFAVGEAGATLYGCGIIALGFAGRLTHDHRRKRHPRRDNSKNCPSPELLRDKRSGNPTKTSRNNSGLAV